MRIGIVGFGIIGSSWAIAALRAHQDVVVHDPLLPAKDMATRIESVRRQVARLHGEAGHGAGTGDIRNADTLASLAAAGCDYIQESIVEELDAKRALFAEFDATAGEETILASSSSALPASRIMGSLSGRHRCIIAHPATPPHLLPAVEVVPAPFTSAESVERTQSVLRALGQKPVLLGKEVDGFAMNRLQGVLLIEMLRLIREGVVSPAGADTLIRDAFGMRWSILGPLEGVHLNAPGGIADYFTRYQAMFDGIRQSPPADAGVLGEEVLAALQAYCTATVTPDAIGERKTWRDERFEELAAWRAKAGLA